MPCSEFQVVILAAGRGTRMTEITSGRPKCLLPVGNQPMLFHSLKIAVNAGFKDAIVLVLKSNYTQIQQTLQQGNLDISVDLVEIPADEDWGTADSLRYLAKQEKVTADVLLISCDVYTNGSISPLLHTFRNHKAAFAALFFQPQESMLLSDVLPGIKSKHKPEKDIVGIDCNTSRLVFLASVSDYEETIPLNHNMLRKHPLLSLRTDLLDAHIYVVTKDLVEYLAADGSYSTLKGEFLPHVASRKHLKDVKESFAGEDHELKDEDGIVKDLSTYIDHKGDLNDVYQGDSVRSYGVLSGPHVFGFRVNALLPFCQANRLCISEPVGNTPRADPSAKISSTQVEPDSFIGAGCVIMEKTSIKASSIGELCTVKPKTSILRSILFKKVEIMEGCIIENCIICDDVVIGAGSKLQNCIVGAHHIVPDQTAANFQVLSKSDGLMEI